MGLARIKVAFGLLAGALTAAWLASVAGGTSTTPWPTTFWQARSLLIPFSGVLAIGFMASGVLLAARPVQVERLLGGLDKFYRLHKWLGIGALVLAVAHWLLEVGPRWMTGWGWITRPARAPRPPGPQPEGFEALMRRLRHPAGEVGEWAFYLMVVLVLLALWKRFPYHLFFKTHRLMAPVFLALVFHSVVMTPQAWWTAPVGVLSGLLMAAATAAPDEAFIAHVRELAEAAGVRFRLYDSNREGFLTPEALKAWAPGWREADVWFCGPAKFGEALRKAMTADGLPAARFHQELFEMR